MKLKEEAVTIFLSTISKRRDVIAFLNELRSFLDRKDFNIDSDIFIIRKRKDNDENYSTPYTLLDLDYDTWDVIDRLKELSVSEYSETKIDKDDLNPPLLYVFGKIIDGKLVYVKLKIKGEPKRYVVCVSFHYAKESMEFPYAK